MHSKSPFKQSPTGELTDPLIELALRVQLSGVPPAYGSWQLTPRPPLHEGEKQPVDQEGRGGSGSSTLIWLSQWLNFIDRAIERRSGWKQPQDPEAAFSQADQGGWLGSGRFFHPGPFKRAFLFPVLLGWWVIFSEMRLHWARVGL